MEGDPDLLLPRARGGAVRDPGRGRRRLRPVVAGLQNDIDEIETEVFGGDLKVSRRIYELSREVIEFQRATSPLLGILDGLMAGFEKYETDEELQRYLRDVADHATTVAERVDGFRQMLADILTVNATLVSQAQNEEIKNLTEASYDQNEEIKKVSAWAAILFAPTLIGTVYGMNFKRMPELLGVRLPVRPDPDAAGQPHPVRDLQAPRRAALSRRRAGWCGAAPARDSGAAPPTGGHHPLLGVVVAAVVAVVALGTVGGAGAVPVAVLLGVLGRGGRGRGLVAGRLGDRRAGAEEQGAGQAEADQGSGERRSHVGSPPSVRCADPSSRTCERPWACLGTRWEESVGGGTADRNANGRPAGAPAGRPGGARACWRWWWSWSMSRRCRRPCWPLETASLAWSALAVAVSATRSLLTLTVLLTSPVRRWTPGFSLSLLAASTICW